MAKKIIKHKVFAYITYSNRLLLFRHTDFPDAGIQVPAGTVKAGEDFHAAVLREAEEETGLKNLEIVSYLGKHLRDMADVGLNEIHHRHFYHLRCTNSPPETWQHFEDDPSDGSPGPIRFEFFWCNLDRLPQLICEHGKLVHMLISSKSS